MYHDGIKKTLRILCIIIFNLNYINKKVSYLQLTVSISLVIEESGGREVGVLREEGVVTRHLSDGDRHLAGLQVQQRRLVQHVTQVLRQVGCCADDTELGAPDVGQHLHQLAAL